jgi:hypothetical protein
VGSPSVARTKRAVSERKLAPWKGTTGLREQFSLLISIKTKRIEQGLLLSHDLLGHELADPDHLIAVTGVGNKIAVLLHHVEDGETIRAERSQTT